MIRKSDVLAPMTGFGGALICVLALAGWWFARMPRPAESLASLSRSEPSTPSASSLLSKPPGVNAPTELRIDIARIMPTGDVVIAGGASPGAKVELLDNGETLMEAQADAISGEFILLPPRLATGAHDLSLRSTNSSNGPHMEVRAIQAFSISPQVQTPPGQADEPAKSHALAMETNGGAAKVLRGDTLWRISRDRLGRGALYPMIFQANSTKIRHPNLVYPGQTLTIP
jgi:hypothetical protein